MNKLLLTATVAVAAGLGLLFGGVFRESSPAAARPPLANAAEAFQASYTTTPNTSALVAQLQSALEAKPKDQRSYVLLGLAYQQRARETGDPTYYTKSHDALQRAAKLDPHDSLALSGLGSLALSRHRFSDALALGRRALRAAPQTARHYGVVGDALVELGRYREGFAAFDKMARLKPSLSAYARISYARELLGRRHAAIAAMQLAVDAAAGAPEAIAWTHVQLGKLFWNHGELARAAAEYRGALAYFPGYAYALDALAQVEAARGHLTRAIALERRAVTAVPQPQYVALLGDLYAEVGKRKLARDQYALVGAIERLLNANGVKTDLEIALFNADHGIKLRETLRRARQAHADRPSIDGDDVLAWTLYRSGRCGEALRSSKRALRLGTQDAFKFFHRGMIERCLGHQTDARTWFVRAYELNPHFSVRWAPTLERALR
jgi:tetratricopeptide (TPR) repeat protein